jgi:hypothetical protein
MTTLERIQALQNFGYDADEARFLTIAALHGGYFLRRQFLNFVGGAKGGKDVVLLKKLETNHHVRVSVYRHNRMVYHLCSKPLYEALGEPNNRNRREHQPATIKNKIMSLDFVLEHQDQLFLATEREKVDYFVATRNIARENLPTRLFASHHGGEPAAKHFVDSYPIYLATGPDGALGHDSVPHFCYVDEDLQTADRFSTYLGQYFRLFTALGDFRVIYVAERPRLFASAERVFQRFSESAPPPANPVFNEEAALAAYFQRRRAYEDQDFSGFDTAGIIRFREEKKRFASDHYEMLYARWKAGDPKVLIQKKAPGQGPDGTLRGRFSAYVLTQDYELFGTIRDISPKRRNPEAPTEAWAATRAALEENHANLEAEGSERPGQDPAGRR